MASRARQTPERDEVIKIRALCQLIKSQCSMSPDARLFFAIFEQALMDVFTMKTLVKSDKYRKKSRELCRQSAVLYLKSSIPHLATLGIEPTWVRKKMVALGLKLP
jgi:hypothetical protein